MKIRREKKEKREKGAPTGIGDIIRSVFEGLDKKTRLTEEDIRAAWKDAAGAEADGHSRPVSLRRQTLVVHVDDSSWLYQMTLEKDRILKKLRERLGEGRIKEIYLRIGDI